MQIHRAGVQAAATMVVIAACSSAGATALDPYPPAPRSGVQVHEPDARLADAVAEYVDHLGLPVRVGGLRSAVTETEWFAAQNLESGESPLAVCSDAARSPATKEYRARYRFTIQPRAGYRLFLVEAHWQRALPPGLDDRQAWEDCRSTGRWERATEERLVLRAKLMRVGIGG